MGEPTKMQFVITDSDGNKTYFPLATQKTNFDSFREILENIEYPFTKESLKKYAELELIEQLYFMGYHILPKEIRPVLMVGGDFISHSHTRYYIGIGHGRNHFPPPQLLQERNEIAVFIQSNDIRTITLENKEKLIESLYSFGKKQNYLPIDNKVVG